MICGNQRNHASDPVGFAEWHLWADQMAKSHRQTKCPECGLWVVWVKKLAAADLVAGNYSDQDDPRTNPHPL